MTQLPKETQKNGGTNKSKRTNKQAKYVLENTLGQTTESSMDESSSSVCAYIIISLLCFITLTIKINRMGIV